jgi:TRAP-type C4-dicarboxylate transport system permease small subunit
MCITIDVSLFYFYLAIPVGSILMMIFLLPHIKKNITGNSEKNESEEEGQEQP